MADRQVKKTGKDKNNTITKLCNSGEAWSPRSKSDAISDIDNGTHSYYVLLSDGTRANVTVAGSGNNKYLRTDKDSTTKNNLAELPDC